MDKTCEIVKNTFACSYGVDIASRLCENSGGESILIGEEKQSG